MGGFTSSTLAFALISADWSTTATSFSFCEGVVAGLDDRAGAGVDAGAAAAAGVLLGLGLGIAGAGAGAGAGEESPHRSASDVEELGNTKLSYPQVPLSLSHSCPPFTFNVLGGLRTMVCPVFSPKSSSQVICDWPPLTSLPIQRSRRMVVG